MKKLLASLLILSSSIVSFSQEIKDSWNLNFLDKEIQIVSTNLYRNRVVDSKSYNSREEVLIGQRSRRDTLIAKLLYLENLNPIYIGSHLYDQDTFATISAHKIQTSNNIYFVYTNNYKGLFSISTKELVSRDKLIYYEDIGKLKFALTKSILRDLGGPEEAERRLERIEKW